MRSRCEIILLAGRLVLILCPFLLIGCANASADEKSTLVADVPVATSSSPSIFPASWQKAPISASGGALAETQYERVLGVLKQAMAKYPENVLQQHLKQVFVLSELKYSGVTASGTNSLTTLYLKVGDVQRGFTNEWIERVFHAEFSSILLRNRGLDTEAWHKLNPPNFQYLGNGVTAIKQGKHGLRLDETLHTKGFLKEYSQSTLENDFNAFAASLFVGDKRVWDLAEKHPKLKGKLELTIAFYHALDPTWTEAKFHSLVAW